MTTHSAPESAKVIISAGHKNFHMLFTAAEMAKRERLSMLIAGAVPRPFEKRLLGKFLGRNRKIQRFLNREEKIDPQLVKQCRASEIISSAAGRFQKLPRGEQAVQRLKVAAMHNYGKCAARHIRRQPDGAASTYHFRAGFGHSSIKAARDRGMQVICDHSIVHPSLLSALVEGKGKFPSSEPPPPTGFWSSVLEDIEAADRVLVNSDFVAKTFAFMGFDMSRIDVAYLGVEDKFMSRLPDVREYRAPADTKPLRLLFAGGINTRKGMDILEQCLIAAPNLRVTLDLAGSLSPEGAQRHKALLADPRVTYRGMLGQQDLANLMSATDVFVFPSFAEGSARVVFEAMAAGCAVITTPNAGSALVDGEGGILIEPGSKDALHAALSELSTSVEVGEMGKSNAELVREKYRQVNYGDKLERTYSK